MDNLIMNINDYKSINQANIEINKLNVVSGVNGSGKSTLSRILYSFLKGNSTKRRDYLFERIVNEFNQIIENLDEDYVDYEFPEPFEVTDSESEVIEKYNSLYEITERHEKLCETRIKELDNEISKEFDSFLKKLENEGFINADEIEFSEDDLFFKIIDLYPLVPNFEEKFEEDIDKLFNLNNEKDFFIHTKMVNFELNLFAQSLKQFIEEDTYKVSEECVQSLLIKEERSLILKETVDFEIELHDNSKVNAYEYFFNNGFIDNIYYFDNVSIFDLHLLNTRFKHIILSHTSDFIDDLFKDKRNVIPDDSTKSIREKIESVIGGKYSNIMFPVFHSGKIDNSAFSEKFPREKRVVTASDTPSGIKQMGIIQLLLLNNKLHKGDYLIIDEPEVNLHPEWQFKFAEILVLLAKELDITIYINSHSPLFIESMDAFCEYYDMQEDINYYLTEPSEEEGKYDFVKINSDEIFRVYDNLGNAYDLIDQLRLKKRLGE